MKLGTLTLAIAMALAVLVGGHTALADTFWYSTQSNWSSDSHLYSYDLATGTSTNLGATAGVSLLTDIAAGASGTLYGIGFPNAYGSGAGKLYSLTFGDSTNPASASELTVNGRLSGVVNGMTWHDGALYVSSNDKMFYKLVADDGTGAWSIAQQGKMSHGSSGDLAFADDGSLYTVVTVGNHSRLATIDIDPNSRHFGKDDFVGGQSGFANVFGLAFDEGTLYGAASSGNFSNSTLVSFNLNTGAAMGLADLGQPVWGMTAVSVGDPVPEPATVALLSAGLVGLVVSRRRRLRSRATSENRTDS